MAKSAFEKFVEARLEEQKKEIMSEAVDDYLKSIPDYNMSLSSFIDQMKKDDLWDQIGSMSVTDLANIVNPPAFGAKSGRSKRLTKAHKQHVLSQIPEFLSKSSWSRKRDIAKAVQIDAKKLNGPLRELVSSKKIKKHGEKGATKYTFIGDKTKP